MQKSPHNHNRLSINNSQQSPHVFLYTQSTPPPAQRIIASKDDAIQQLIIQNTHLKRQLSQLMLKTSTQPTPLQTALQSPQHYNTLQSSKQYTAIQSPKYNTIQSSIQSGLQSPIQNGNIIRPNTIQFNSMLRNSLQNTMKSNFYNKNIKNTTNVTHNTNNNSFHNHNNTSAQGINNNGLTTIRQTPTSPINRGHLVHPHHSPPNHYSPSHNQPNIPSNNRQNRSYRHSIDMCTNLQQVYNNYPQYYQQSVNNSINNQSNSNQYKNHNHKVQYSLTSQQYYQPKVNNYNNNNYRNNNNTIVIPEIRMQPLSNQVNDHIMQQDQLIQQQLYRQKMMKLKNKKSPRSRQLSEQNKSKQFSQQKYNHNTQQQYNHANYVNRTNGDNSNNKNKMNNNNIRDVRKQQLMKAHQILKAKLNNNNNNNSNNNNSNRYQQQNNTKITKNNNQFLQQKQQKQQPKQQPKQQLSITSFQAQSKSPIKKLISTQDIKLIQQVKKLPKYIPKSFSKSKLSTQQQQQNMQINKMDRNKDNNKVDNYPVVKSKKSIQPNKQFTIIETTLRLKTQPKQLEQSNSVKQSNSIKQKNKQKKICLSQLKGRVYLDDQNQQKQKTKRTINHKHITQMNHNLMQLTNRPTPQQTPNSIKKLSTDYINTINKKTDDDRLIMMRKNSNKIYLQEDQDNKSKNKQNTNSSNCNNNQGFNKIIVQGNNTVNTNRRQQVHHDIVSIQEIHMISDQDNIKNINNNNIQPTPISKPSLKHQKQPSQQQSSIINKALSIKSPSSSQQQRKQLYNHIYCQQSKTKFK